MSQPLWEFADEMKTRYGAAKPIQCKENRCPQFDTCTKPGPAVRTFKSKPPSIFLVSSFTTPHEEKYRTVGADRAGWIMQTKFVNTMLRMGLVESYAITKLFRAAVPFVRPFEMQFCLKNFFNEIFEHAPKTLVVFGEHTFSTLYDHAANKNQLPVKKDHTLISLRGKVFTLAFERGDQRVETEVFVAFDPAVVIEKSEAIRFIEQDARTFAHYMLKTPVAQRTFTVNKITALETAPEIFDFLDMLTRGLKEDTVCAFDTETYNLNKIHNNAFLTWQFSYKRGESVVFPIEHKERPVFADPVLKKKFVEKANTLFNLRRDESKIKWFVGHQIKFEFSVMWGLLGVTPRHANVVPWYDTLLGMHWLDENRKPLSQYLGKPFALKTLGKEFLNFHFEEEALEARGGGSLQNLTLEQLYTYGGSDSALTLDLFYYEAEIAKRQPDSAIRSLAKFQEKYYFPASWMVAIMETNGIYINPAYLAELQSEDSPLWNRVDEIEKDIQEIPEIKAFRKEYAHKLGGVKKNAHQYEDNLWDDETDDSPLFDLNKADQQTLLYLDYLKLPVKRQSKKTGKDSLDSKFFEQFQNQNVYKASSRKVRDHFAARYDTPVKVEDDGTEVFVPTPPSLHGEYRKLKKLGTSYLNSLESMLLDKKGDSLDDRIRASYWLSGTDTGRLSSTNPNLQNLPAGKTKMAKVVKNIFQAQPPCAKFPNGTVLIQGDYKTAEVRWAAIFSGDQNLLTIFSESAKVLEDAITNEEITEEDFKAARLLADLHRRTASLMFGVPAENVEKSMRQAAKCITFGLLFGMTVERLATENGWSLEEGQRRLEQYFSAFPDLQRWLEDRPNVAKAKGYVSTFMDRRRHLDHFFATGHFGHESRGGRRAMNASIQGQSSDAMALGIVNFVRYVFDHGLEKRWLLQNMVHDSCLVQAPKEDLDQVLKVMRECLVTSMRTYIEDNWNCKLPIPIELEFEIGLRYGALKEWDGRQKTLKKIFDQLDEDAKELWVPYVEPKEPSKQLDLVTYAERGR